jgi:hypothetical protein
MLNEFKHIEPHYIFTIDNFPGMISAGTLRGPRLPFPEYLDMLGDSIFCPCPMGNVNVDCQRICEALDCGTIPIAEDRTGLLYYRGLFGPNPIPTVPTWREGRRWVAKIVQTPEAISELQRECIAWWRDYQERYTAEIGPFLLKRLNDDTSVQRPMYEPKANSVIWQVRELIRHHDSRALARRLRLQAKRLLSGRGFRVAAGRGRPV